MDARREETRRRHDAAASCQPCGVWSGRVVDNTQRRHGAGGAGDCYFV